MSITPLPPAPNRNDPATFSDRADTFVAALSTLVTEINDIPGIDATAGFRNAIINGGFDHWQRGTSFTASAYGADRWRNNIIVSTATQSQQAFAPGQTDVPNEPEYFARTVVSSVAGADNFSALQQRIENVRAFAGRTVTLSFYAKADAAKNIAVEFSRVFGISGSSFEDEIGVTKLALTTTFQKFTITATIPSIAGKTIGEGSFLQLSFFFDAGSDFNARTNSLGQQSGTFDIAQVQLEAGSVDTPFERRPVGTELVLCQRYFEVVSKTANRVSMANHSTGGGIRWSYSFKATKRAVPAISITDESKSSELDNASIAGIATDGVNFLSNFNTATSNASNISVGFRSDAEL